MVGVTITGMQTRDLAQAIATIAKASEFGAVPQSLTSWFFDTAGNCTQPVGFTVRGAPAPEVTMIDGALHYPRQVAVQFAGPMRLAPGSNVPLYLDGNGRCRRCANCLRWRSRVWAYRALNEIAKSSRTWFVTLTLREQAQYYYLEKAREASRARGLDLDAQTPNDQFVERCNQIGRQLTLCLKRVRKNTGCNIRYMFVFEAHESGAPHLHGLLHEPDAINVVTKAEFQREWHLGFSNMKLVNDETSKAAWYVCKYLSKDARNRIRASLRYGAEETLVNLTHRKKAVKKLTATPKPQGQVNRSISITSVEGENGDHVKQRPQGTSGSFVPTPSAEGHSI